ncbi:MAG: hypothetical protein KAH31_04685 [Candidatus Sabulitectum sp.]|nr:hypothetical protein [Candidatus Sabulitectum sp.]
MNDNPVLIAVLQMDDLESLNSAVKHMEEKGLKAEVGKFTDLPKSQIQNWVTPKNGSFILYVEEEKYGQWKFWTSSLVTVDSFFTE